MYNPKFNYQPIACVTVKGKRLTTSNERDCCSCGTSFRV